MTTLGHDIRELLHEQVVYRELLAEMIKRDLTLRYKQTIMGFGWAIFMPLVNTAVFSVMFMRVAPMDTGVPYPLFAYCGLWAWNLLGLVAAILGDLAHQQHQPCHQGVLPPGDLSVLGDRCLHGGLRRGRVGPGRCSWRGITSCQASIALWLPVVLLVQVAITAAVGLLLAMANLFYRDVKYLFEVVLTVWMFATSVVYPIQLVGGRLGALLASQPDDTHHRRVSGRAAAESVAASRPRFSAPPPLSMVLLGAAWIVFHRAEYTFAENV